MASIRQGLMKITGLDKIIQQEVALRAQVGGISTAMTGGDDLVGDLAVVEEALSQFNMITRMHRERKMRYRDYDAMDNYGDVSVALDIYAEEATQNDLLKETNLWVTGDPQATADVEEAIQKLRLRTMIQGFSRQLAKYGDMFIHQKFSVEGLDRILYLPPQYVERVGPSVDRVKFYRLDQQLHKVSERGDGLLLPWEAVHFRMLSFGFSTLYGRCVAEGSKVWTTRGLVPIEDVTPGDTVQLLNPVTNQFETTDVKATVCNGEKDVVEVHTEHRVIRVTKEHPLPYVGYKGRVSWVAAQDLKRGQRLAIAPRNIVHVGQDVPIVWPSRFTSYKQGQEEQVRLTERGVSNAHEGFVLSGATGNRVTNISEESCALSRRQSLAVLRGEYATPKENLEKLFAELGRPLSTDDFSAVRSQRFGIQRFPAYVDESFARWFGFMLGDGWASSTQVSFSEGEHPELNEYYTQLTEKLFGCSVRHAASSTSSKFGSFYVSSVELVDMLDSMGWVSGAHNKVIPPWVFVLPAKIQEQFIWGLLDADGWRTEQNNVERFHVELCNEGLVSSLRELVESLGYVVGKVRTRDPRFSEIRGVPHKSSRTWLLTFQNAKMANTTERVQKVVPAGSSRVYDLETGSEHHNFVVGGVPVHNSIIEPARKRWLHLKLLEDAVAIYRLNRAVERIIFYVDVGSASPTDALRIVNQYKRKFGNKRSYIDPTSATFEQQYDPHHMLENLFWPVNSATERSRIEKLPPPPEQGQLQDLDHFNEKLYVALGIPRDYLTGEVTGAWNSREALALQDVRFSRKLHRLQVSLLEGIEQMMRFHLAVKWGDAEMAQGAEFQLHLSDVSKVARQQYDQIVLNRVQLIQMLNDLGSQLSLNRDVWVPWILKSYFPDIPEDLLGKLIIPDAALRAAQQDQQRDQLDLARGMADIQVASAKKTAEHQAKLAPKTPAAGAKAKPKKKSANEDIKNMVLNDLLRRDLVEADMESVAHVLENWTPGEETISMTLEKTPTPRVPLSFLQEAVKNNSGGKKSFRASKVLTEDK